MPAVGAKLRCSAPAVVNSSTRMVAPHAPAQCQPHMSRNGGRLAQAHAGWALRPRALAPYAGWHTYCYLSRGVNEDLDELHRPAAREIFDHAGQRRPEATHHHGMACLAGALRDVFFCAPAGVRPGLIVSGAAAH